MAYLYMYVKHTHKGEYFKELVKKMELKANFFECKISLKIHVLFFILCIFREIVKIPVMGFSFLYQNKPIFNSSFHRRFQVPFICYTQSHKQILNT